MNFPGIEYQDYEESRYNVEEVIDLLDIGLKKTGNWYNGSCPFHKDSNPSFGLNIYSGLWNCFTCGAGGLETLVGKVLDLDNEDDVLRWLRPFNKYIEATDLDGLSDKLLSIELANKKKESSFDDYNFRLAIWVRNVGRKYLPNNVLEDLLRLYDRFVHTDNLQKAKELGDYMMNNFKEIR